jgi:hypothetical protein
MSPLTCLGGSSLLVPVVECTAMRTCLECYKACLQLPYMEIWTMLLISILVGCVVSPECYKVRGIVRKRRAEQRCL